MFKEAELTFRRFKQQVLIIDDNISCSTLAASLFLAEGCAVDVHENGLSATKALLTKSYNLILLDWDMPICNGSETLLLMERQVEAATKIPFVLFTGFRPEEIEIPKTDHFQMVDFWHKKELANNWHRKTKELIQRVRR